MPACLPTHPPTYLPTHVLAQLEDILRRTLEPAQIHALAAPAYDNDVDDPAAAAAQLLASLSPLMRAALSADVVAVRSLLRGSRVGEEALNAKDVHGHSALMHASAEGSDRHAKVLDAIRMAADEAGLIIDVNAVSVAGDCALHMAVYANCCETVSALLGFPDIDLSATGRSEPPMTPLQCAAREGRTGVIDTLLWDSRADVNFVKPPGVTALMHAANSGHAQAVQTLMAVDGIDLNWANPNAGGNALMCMAPMTQTGPHANCPLDQPTPPLHGTLVYMQVYAPHGASVLTIVCHPVALDCECRRVQQWALRGGGCAPRGAGDRVGRQRSQRWR
mgnify:CR=1 FL=1